ncbi:hypothetical protein [Aurantiacibacter gangjinensis]|uniref:Uncharacterized protein n=1 Tax=Aurantiacibacter gangjinensis TaxID=502682 RepID=A0A0G9MLN1_9SPHN|nr:hypothetical protein [Aurantiacibacter gangjinensis]APE27490.1 hypothetical protein BMF35_a0661 [Aurantiacibacter gangjinensis]KLE31549.1 hypothetical protein AAW01_08280 [Aurantiacibacter gangjinensis]
MALVITFILGMGNFACQRAALESSNALITNMPPPILWMLRALEFVLLAGALYAAASGATHWLWIYAGYTLLNIGSAWAIATGRMG